MRGRADEFRGLEASSKSEERIRGGHAASSNSLSVDEMPKHLGSFGRHSRRHRVAWWHPVKAQGWLRLTPRRSAVLAAIAYAFVPLTIKLTAHDTNPFYYILVSKIAQIPVIAIALAILYRLYFRSSQLSIGNLLKARSSYFVVYRNGTPDQPSGIRDCLRMPMFWLTISFLDYTMFTWSTHYVDAAVSTAIFELWPVFFVALLIWVPKPENGGASNDNSRGMNSHDWMLIVLAPIGLFFIYISQTSDIASLFHSGFSQSLIGMLIALGAAVLSGATPSMTILYGELLHTQYQDKLRSSEESQEDATATPQTSSNTSVRDQQLWFTLFGFLLSISLSAIYNLVGGFVFDAGLPDVTLASAGGGALLGAVLLAPAAILLRKANHDTDDPSVNGIFFFAPVLALLLLFWTDIGVANRDLFAIGAALVLTVNILIQANPDRESDLRKLGETPVRGNRIGFTAMILAIWAFGSAIYLRDDVVSHEWLSWRDANYWGLLALSATIFALIFGFRVARATSRIGKEDDAMLELFRRCEHLLSRTNEVILDHGILDDLRSLDRANPSRRIRLRQDTTLDKHGSTASHVLSDETNDCHITEADDQTEDKELSELFRSYIATRAKLLDARRRLATADIKSKLASEIRIELNELEWQLDTITHSKQQGRDFSELMSLTIFAAITILLGVGARPAGLDLSSSGWSGFLTELFAMLFVATIAFLAVNLFDIRRDREIPLIVGIDARQQEEASAATDDGEELKPAQEYILFFRQRRDLAAQRVIAVLVTLGLCLLFGALLYSKWLW